MVNGVEILKNSSHGIVDIGVMFIIGPSEFVLRLNSLISVKFNDLKTLTQSCNHLMDIDLPGNFIENKNGPNIIFKV